MSDVLQAALAAALAAAGGYLVERAREARDRRLRQSGRRRTRGSDRS